MMHTHLKRIQLPVDGQVAPDGQRAHGEHHGDDGGAQQTDGRPQLLIGAARGERAQLLRERARAEMSQIKGVK